MFAVILGVLSLPGLAPAQDDAYISPATSALQDVLSNLKQSVEKLSLDNDQLEARDNAIKQQIAMLQSQLNQMEDQGERLSNEAGKLQDKNPRRSQEIAQLEEKDFDLDNRLQKTESSIRSMQQSLGSEDGQGPESITPAMQAADHDQKERLKLMKMIYDSQQRQESLHEAISGFQKNTPVLPAAAALERQEALKEQIKSLEAEIAGYPPDDHQANGGALDQGDEAQVVELELELKTLEENYSQLKYLMQQMGKKAKLGQMTDGQHVELEKIQGNITDLNRQGVALKVELDDLRSQMVDLDKRKSRLEMMISQLP